MFLYIIAGPNGAGKSFYSRNFTKIIKNHSTIKVWDLDKVLKQKWKKVDYDNSKKEALKIETYNEFDQDIEHCIANNLPFAFEHNFHDDIYIEDLLEKFQSNNYVTSLFFVYINNPELCFKRVNYRHKYKDLHFVDKQTVELRYKQGLMNLSCFYQDFDTIIIFDNSEENNDNDPVMFPRCMITKGHLHYIHYLDSPLFKQLPFLNKLPKHHNFIVAHEIPSK